MEAVSRGAGDAEMEQEPEVPRPQTITGQTTDEINALMIPVDAGTYQREIFKICQDKRVAMRADL